MLLFLTKFAKVNWRKSEAVAVGRRLLDELVPPGGLPWKKGGSIRECSEVNSLCKRTTGRML